MGRLKLGHLETGISEIGTSEIGTSEIVYRFASLLYLQCTAVFSNII